MDDSPNCSDFISNNDIIDDLTKDLQSSCVKEDDKSAECNDDTKSNVKCENAEGNSEEGCKTQREEEASCPKDFVDEELLKNREVTLTESEKETLRQEAEELKNKGNDRFKDGEYMEAITFYTDGLRTCPLAYSKDRAILYANRAAAKSKSLEKESAISDCTKAIELNPSYVKAYVRRAQLNEETDKLDEALEDYKKVLTFDPGHTEANYAVRRLPPMIQEKNEKLKTEILGKLKDLGNMVLKPFGLSTNNFELQKDPNSEGYSVKFHQNPS